MSFSLLATKLTVVPGYVPSVYIQLENLKRSFPFVVLPIRPWISFQTVVFLGIGVDSGLNTA